MMDRTIELQHLAEIDQRIESGERVVATVRALRDHRVANGFDLEETNKLSESAQKTAAQFHEIRNLILGIIADIDAGFLARRLSAPSPEVPLPTDGEISAT